MQPSLFIGLGAGLVSAVLFASAASGSFLAFLLFCLAPLPIFLAGLGWGLFAAIIATLSGMALALIVLGAKVVGFALTIAIPASALCYATYLNRTAMVPSGTQLPKTKKSDDPIGSSPTIEWYPIGHILAWATLFAGLLAALSVPLIGTNWEAYQNTIRTLLEQMVLPPIQANSQTKLSDADIKTLVKMVAVALPAVSASLWLLITILNLWLAALIVRTSGRLLRSWPDISKIEFPRNFSLGFAAALCLWFAPGLLGVMSGGFVGAFVTAYALLGLAVIHFITRASPNRPFLLFGLYMLLLIFSWSVILVAAIGVVEPISKLRERMQGKTPPPSSLGG